MPTIVGAAGGRTEERDAAANVASGRSRVRPERVSRPYDETVALVTVRTGDPLLATTTASDRTGMIRHEATRPVLVRTWPLGERQRPALLRCGRARPCRSRPPPWQALASRGTQRPRGTGPTGRCAGAHHPSGRRAPRHIDQDCGPSRPAHLLQDRRVNARSGRTLRDRKRDPACRRRLSARTVWRAHA